MWNKITAILVFQKKIFSKISWWLPYVKVLKTLLQVNNIIVEVNTQTQYPNNLKWLFKYYYKYNYLLAVKDTSDGANALGSSQVFFFEPIMYFS